MTRHTIWQETHQSLETHTGSFLQDRISNSKPQAFCICGPTCCFNYTVLLHTLSTWHSLQRVSVNGWGPQKWQLWKNLWLKSHYEKTAHSERSWFTWHNFLKLVYMSIQLMTGNYKKFMSQHLLCRYLKSNTHNTINSYTLYFTLTALNFWHKSLSPLWTRLHALFVILFHGM